MTQDSPAEKKPENDTQGSTEEVEKKKKTDPLSRPPRDGLLLYGERNDSDPGKDINE